MRRIALLFLVGCGTQGGVLVDVTESKDVGADVDTLRVFVGTPDSAIGGYAGVVQPEDVIALDPPLREKSHTIELVASGGLTTDTPVRIAVVGKSAGTPVALGLLDVTGIPSDVVLRYPLELEPVGDVTMTPSGCLLLPDGTVVAAVDDQDCDGVTKSAGDCNDLDPTIHPGAYDACSGASLGIDDDCDGTVDNGDADGDGADCQSDCDDQDPARTPGKPDNCNDPDNIDNDCDFEVDEADPEICGDGIDNDCNPLTPDQATDEVCADGFDNDCDGAIDEGGDQDGDGFDCSTDCDDDPTDPIAAFIHPGASEVCDQLDDDCDGIVDEDANDDQDPAPCLLDCDDEDPNAFPGNPEICDGIDNDCNPSTLPEPKPCLTTSVTPCAYGFEQCDENLGVYGTCVADASGATPLPDGVCNQFHQCVDDPRGLGCAGQPTHACTQFLGDAGNVCQGASAPLAGAANVGSCSWVLLGGTMQQGWTVGLIGGTVTTPQPMLGSCTGSFAVVDTPQGFQPGEFVVVEFVNGTYDHSEVFDIGQDEVGACPLPSLECSNG